MFSEQGRDLEVIEYEKLVKLFVPDTTPSKTHAIALSVACRYLEYQHIDHLAGLPLAELIRTT
jgi:hypothetical protein